MSERERQDLTHDERRVRDAVSSLPRVEANPDFRDRLKAEFVGGRLGEGAPAPLGSPARKRRRWRFLVPVFAAAALLLLVTTLNRGPALVLSDVTGEGTVTVDGRVYEASEREEIADAVRPGGRITLSGGVEMDIVYPQTMVIQLSSATATIPRAPARWFGNGDVCRIEIGEVRVLTGPAFRGSRLDLASPEGWVRVTGTLVSVFRDSSLTCVCVHEGTAGVGVDVENLESIPPGKRKVMYADGRPPIVTDIAPPHMDHLVEFERKYRDGIVAR